MHRHHGRHLPGLHHRAHGDRGLPDADAPLQVRHSIDMLRPDGAASVTSPDRARRASVSLPRDEAGEADGAGGAARLQLERQKASAREGILKRSLADVNAFSTSMTKQLDDTYHAVLEKLGTLQSTVTAMKGLAETLRGMCDGFDDDARALESDTVRQVIAMGHFDAQEAKIAGLQGRILQGRTRIQQLTDRVDVARQRIEAWERADRAWREKTRKRLKIIWSVSSIVTILFVALMVGANHYAARGLDDAGAGLSSLSSSSSSSSSPNLSLPSAADGGNGRTGARAWTTAPANDDLLRLFDEL